MLREKLLNIYGMLVFKINSPYITYEKMSTAKYENRGCKKINSS